MKLTKKAQKQISSNINRLMCYSGMITSFNEKKDSTRAFQMMRAYNEAADELIAMGIKVNRYNVEGVGR